MISAFPILTVRIQAETDVVLARQRARLLANELKFVEQDQIRIATAVSELARNVYQYVGAGSVEFSINMASSPQSLVIVVKDQGSGISNLNEILRGQYVSKTGMGVGLIGAKKLMDDFSIETSSSGTTVTLTKFLARHNQLQSPHEIATITKEIQKQRNADYFGEIRQQNQELIQALGQIREKQEELSHLNEELSETNRGVVALYAELDEKAASLQKANEIKTSFLSNMTHEFRTPLTSIMSLSRLLLDRMDGPLTEEQERQVRYIRQSAENLLELVSDLLDLAKVEAGKISLKPSEFSLGFLFGALRGVFRPLIPMDAPIQLEFECDPQLTVYSDEAKLGQVLRNLISNAIKYTEKGQVTVRAEVVGDELQISVRDTGIGIAPEHQVLIFKDFTQIDSNLQRRSRGTGLGLPLSKKLARLLGGDLWVDSKLNEGSTFTLKIPRQYQGQSEGFLFESPKEIVEAPCVLLIDGDEASRYILKSTLISLQTLNIHEASSAEEARKFLEQNKPDAIFMEVALPDSNGFELLRHFREDPTWADIPVFINTARILSADEKDILAQLTSGVISKSNLQSEENKKILSEIFGNLRRAQNSRMISKTLKEAQLS